MRIGALLVLLAAVWASPLSAETSDEPAQLYAAGHYLAAAKAAESHASPDSFTLAARALLAACIAGGERRQTAALLDRAERLANEALELDPDTIDARLQLALVYGMRGRRVSVPEAFARGFAPRGRRLIDQALTLAPQDARPHAMLGAWHLEVLRRGGSAGAFAYGARFADGAAAFERALSLAPNDLMIPLQYAIALLEFDARSHAARVADLLARAAAMPARDAFEQHALGVAAALAQTLAEQGPRAAATQAGSLSP
jgi:hypothetical protein